MSSEMLVRALVWAGFSVYRNTPESIILERGIRAVAVPARKHVRDAQLMDVRRMAGLSWQELDTALSQTKE